MDGALTMNSRCSARYTGSFAMRRALVAAGFVVAAAAGPVTGRCEGDPTAPPVGLALSIDGGALAGAAKGAASAPHRAAASAPQPPRLFAVRVGGDRPASAIVDGRLVQPGDRVGESIVSDISERGLVLRARSGELHLLVLAPGVVMTPHRIEAATAAPHSAVLARKEAP
jgi:hypothetical protein